MCWPVGVFWAEAFPGGHIGPPLRGGGGVPNQRKIGAKTGPFQRGGTEPAPYRGSGAGRCVHGGGVRSPRPTGTSPVVPSEGLMYLGHGFRRPYFGTKFGVSVMGIGPYALRMGGMGGDRSRDYPQSTQQLRTIPQSRLRRASSLCTREPYGRRMQIAAGHHPRPCPIRGSRAAARRGRRALRPAGDGGAARRSVVPYGRQSRWDAGPSRGHLEPYSASVRSTGRMGAMVEMACL